MLFFARSSWLRFEKFYFSFSADKVYDEDHFRYFRVSVKSSGQAMWHPGGIYKISCPLDVTYFPFDSQVGSSEICWTFLHQDTDETGSCIDNSEGLSFPHVCSRKKKILKFGVILLTKNT